MHVLAMIADDSRQTVERALGSAHALVVVRNARSITQALRSWRFQALVLDPVLLSDRELDALSVEIARLALPLVLHTRLSPESAKRVIHIAERGAHELILCGAEDEPGLLRHKLAHMMNLSAPALLLNRVAAHIAAFPPPLQTLSVRLFSRGSLPRRVGDVARDTGYGRRTIDRLMSRAGLSGASVLLDTARLAHVWEPLVERGLAPPEAAALCGYDKRRTLTAHALRLVGVRPAQIARVYTRQRFVDQLTRALLTDSA